MTSFPVVALSQPAELDIIGYRGDSGRFRVTITEAGAPVDVTSAVWDADVRTNPDAPVLATMTVVPVAGQTNAIDVVLPAEQSAAITDTGTVGTPTTDPDAPPTTEVVCVWDLEMTLGTAPNATTTTLLRGKVTMIKDVSRPLPPASEDAPPEGPPEGPPLVAATAGATEPAGAGLGPPPQLANGQVLQRLGGPTAPPPGAPAPGPTTMPKL